MKLTFDFVKKVSLSLYHQLSIRSGVSISVRDCAIFRFKASDGKLFFAELAPLPGLHRESLAEAINFFETILEENGHVIDLRGIDQDEQEWTQPFFGYLPKKWDQLPSVTTAFEQIIWASHHHYQKTCFRSTFDIAGFVPNLKQIDTKSLQNCNVVKVKIGRFSESEEIDLLLRLKETLRPEVRLRLDANQSISEQYFSALDQIRTVLNIEFIEEPFKESFHALRRREEVLIGLDESLYDMDPVQILEPCMLALKPSRLSMSKSIDWVRKQQNRNLAVISSSYESALGSLYLMQLADFLGVHTSLGLGTHLQFKEDVFSLPLFEATGPACIDTRFSDASGCMKRDFLG